MPRLCIATRFLKYKRRAKTMVDLYHDVIYPKMVRKRNRTKGELGYAKCFILGAFFKNRRIGHVTSTIAQTPKRKRKRK